MNGIEIMANRLCKVLILAVATAGLCHPTVWASEQGVLEEAPELGEGDNGLKAMLGIEAETFRRGEGIPLKLSLRNVSSKPFLIYRFIGANAVYTGCMKFFLQRAGDAAREVTHGGLKQPHANEANHVRLGPGTSLIHRLCLKPSSEENAPVASNCKGLAVNSHDPLGPGKYELWVKVIYRNDGKNFGVRDAWTGEVISNPVRFQVLEAQARVVPSNG